MISTLTTIQHLLHNGGAIHSPDNEPSDDNLLKTWSVADVDGSILPAQPLGEVCGIVDKDDKVNIMRPR